MQKITILMKKKHYLTMAFVCLLAAATLCACGKDDDDGISSDLIGTWQSASYEGMDGEYPISGTDTGVTLTFRGNGTMTATEDGESGEFRWKVDGNLLCFPDYEDGEWYLRIVKLTSTEMILDHFYDPNPDNDDGSYLNYTYKKIK
jgi:hypothetical protein